VFFNMIDYGFITHYLLNHLTIPGMTRDTL
jgi:hypothetical protein